MKAGGCAQTAVAISFSNGSEKTQFLTGGSTARAVAIGGTEMKITRDELIRIYDALRDIQQDFLETADILESMASTMRAYKQELEEISDLIDEDAKLGDNDEN